MFDMVKNKKGKIINFAGGGDGPFPHFSAYSASKISLIRLTETVAAEYKESGIDINIIAPGPVNTYLLEESLAAGMDKVGEEQYKKFLKQKEEGGVPPEKAAGLCVFLASSRSNGLTGRYLSAVWDNYDAIPDHLKEIIGSDAYTLRRVKPEDRGIKI
jgi:NAD(P)-dependent dehydrogenase (short-subunit alcohol dehydrogenase family)